VTDGQPAAQPGMQRLGRLFGALVAPSTFVTALLYYFGYHHAYWFFDYFGVNSTTLGFGPADYLMRSLDALFVPMLVIAGAGVAALWGHELLRARLTTGPPPRALRTALPIAEVTGLLLTTVGVWSALDSGAFLRRYLLAAPGSIAFGVILLVYTRQIRRVLPVETPAPDPPSAGDAGDSAEPAAPAPDTQPDPEPAPLPSRRPEWADLTEWAAASVLVGLSLIWAANDYAAAVGWGRAAQLATELPTSTTAVVYSERSLDIAIPGVREIHCENDKSAYPYRYEGLTLVLQSGGQYVLLPQNWTPSTGIALILPRSETIRLEFVPYSARQLLGRHPC
jgi:hypothetical protein